VQGVGATSVLSIWHQEHSGWWYPMQSKERWAEAWWTGYAWHILYLGPSTWEKPWKPCRGMSVNGTKLCLSPNIWQRWLWNLTACSVDLLGIWGQTALTFCSVFGRENVRACSPYAESYKFLGPA